MLLRVIKERFTEDGLPWIDPASGASQRQYVNGGQVRILDPKTQIARTYLPGEVMDLPDQEAKDLLLNAPNSVEPEERHLAREKVRRSRDTVRESERDALDARMREMGRETEQAQKLRAMAEQRERDLAAENLRVAQNASGKDSLLDEMRRQVAEIQAAAQAKIAEMEARLAMAMAAPAPADQPGDAAAEAAVESKQAKRKANG